MKLRYTQPVSFSTLIEQVESYEALEQRLREIVLTQSGQMFPGVHLIDEAGNCLAIGMADEGWLLIHNDAAHTRMLYSVGADESEAKLSYLFEEANELSARHLVPIAKAIEVIREWVMTGHLPDLVTWEVHLY